jgi:hypothetical protein
MVHRVLRSNVGTLEPQVPKVNVITRHTRMDDPVSGLSIPVIVWQSTIQAG